MAELTPCLWFFDDDAEAALTRGDLEGFARAWEALKRTLRSP